MEGGGRAHVLGASLDAHSDKDELGFLLYACRGSLNARLTHESTLEFSSEERLGLRGDCVACIEGAALAKRGWCEGGKTRIEMLIVPPPWRDGKPLLLTVDCGRSCRAEANDLVLRKSDFCDDRTLAAHCPVCAACLSSSVRNALRNSFTRVFIVAKCVRIQG